MKNEVYLRLILEGTSMSFDEITNLLIIEPSIKHKKDSLIYKNGTKKHKTNKWIYEIYKKNVIHTDELLDYLRKKFTPKLNSLVHLGKKYNISVLLICYLKEGSPSIVVEKKNLSFLHKIGATFSIDTYCL